MKKFNNFFLTVVCLLITVVGFSQTRSVSGTVLDDAGQPIIAATVRVTGTQVGTVTDLDGKFSLEAPQGATSLTISFVGMQPEIIPIQDNVTVTLQSEDNLLEGVVVTALGVTRDRRALSYSTQQISQEELNTSKQDNIVNSLSGKFAGVDVVRSNNMGGSSQVTIRGNSLLSGNNGALIVIDGVPVNNSSINSANQQGGGYGYDYGNAASDLNPDNIADVTVLKGSSATALYGERAGNGVILITTKKGDKKKGLGVSFTSMAKMGQIDKDTFVKYQKDYGAGYAPFYYGSTGGFDDADINGDGISDLVVPTYEDGSYGAKFDPDLNVYQWYSFVPESEYFGQATPWVAAEHTPVDFFETSSEFNNSIALEGSNDKGNFRFGYTNFTIGNSNLPNSELKKNNITVRGGYNFSDKLSADVNIDFFNQYAKGRNSTGYGDNLMSMFRQWWQTNVDVKQLERLYNKTGRNVTWNMNEPINGDYTPKFWDNPYWTRYKNYQDDSRDRLFGYARLNYAFNDFFTITGRVSQDVYDETREERRAVGSVPSTFGLLLDDEPSGYQNQGIKYSERNYELFMNLNDKDLGTNWTISGLLGGAIRKNTLSRNIISTAGGLIVPELYTVKNSVNPTPFPFQYDSEQQTNSAYGQLSLGYKDWLFFEFTDRYDVNSNLPNNNNGYNYFSIGGSGVLSDLFDARNVDLLKLRGSFAQVGAGPRSYRVLDTYSRRDGLPNSYFSPSRKNNPDLKPERTDSFEIGLEGAFFNNRLGFDFAYYNNDTYDQLYDVEISRATGYREYAVNAGNINNKGVELALYGSPVKKEKFHWNTRVNFTDNNNKVTKLFVDPETGEATQNVVLDSFQGSIRSNARLGEPLGILTGFGYKIDENTGQRVVNSAGYYVSEANQVIADPNPDFKWGWYNSFKFGNFNASFLLDAQHGGDVYSLDTHYGQSTGVSANTSYINANGVNVREPVSEGGGVLFKGVTADGQPNEKYARADYYGGAFYWGNSSRNPGQLTVYDAGFVKLREFSLGYNFNQEFVEKSFLSDMSISLVGNNVWILHKNVPYADPESGLGNSVSNGYLSGSYPTNKTLGLRLNLKF